MQLVATNPSRKSQQVWLKFSDDTLLPLKIDDLAVLNIKKFVEISDDTFAKIQMLSSRYLLLEYCLRQIAISPKVESVLRQKIRQYIHRINFKYGLPSPVMANQVDSIIDKLNNDNLLSHQDYFDHLVRKYPKKSSMELNYLLKSKGISLQISVNSEQEIDKIKQLISKKYSRVDLSDYMSKNQLIAKISRKGFPIEFIKTAIDELSFIR
jgi:SOS response regulatory protein OraA/RecX